MQNTIRGMVPPNWGDDVWESILRESGEEDIGCWANTADSTAYNLAKAACKVLELPLNMVLEAAGGESSQAQQRVDLLASRKSLCTGSVLSDKGSVKQVRGTFTDIVITFKVVVLHAGPHKLVRCMVSS